MLLEAVVEGRAHVAGTNAPQSSKHLCNNAPHGTHGAILLGYQVGTHSFIVPRGKHTVDLYGPQTSGSSIDALKFEKTISTYEAGVLAGKIPKDWVIPASQFDSMLNKH